MSEKNIYFLSLHCITLLDTFRYLQVREIYGIFPRTDLHTFPPRFPHLQIQIHHLEHVFQQGSLSRAFGLRPRSEKASPSSSSDTGSLASQYMSSARSNSPPPPQLPPRPITGNKRHRRVKSIGDIDYITSAAVSTPV